MGPRKEGNRTKVGAGGPDRRARRTEATRREIREAAARLFFARGFREVTMADIGREVGLSPGSLYYYFRNKEEILRELDAECVGRFEAFLDEFSPGVEGLREWVVTFFEDVFRFARDNRDYFVFLTRLVSSVHPALLGEIAKSRVRAFGKALARMTEAMRAFQEQGVARTDLPAEELAHVLGGLVHSLLFSWFMGMVGDGDLRRKASVFAEIFARGVGAREG